MIIITFGIEFLINFIFQLSNVVAGQYKYKLTVSDEQGISNSQVVTINVFEDPLIMNLVEVILTAKASELSQQEVRDETNV
jgi:hypothetical protein